MLHDDCESGVTVDPEMRRLKIMPKKALMATLASLTLAAPLALAHLVDEQPLQSYRQSYFTLLAMNFGPIAGMVKGEVPWNEEMLMARAADFKAVTTVDVSRAFAPGSDKGTTRAKPAIWDNTDDFVAKYRDLQAAADKLLAAAKTGERDAVAAAVRDTGGACKACHDEYKSKDYLY
jgi:cytochrome c556